jgi:ribose-phosphate pyrophosphokinase
LRKGETAIEIKETVRDNDVFVINPTCNPNPNDYLMEVLIIMDACRRAGAGRITAVLPIFGYARQARTLARSTRSSASVCQLMDEDALLAQPLTLAG